MVEDLYFLHRDIFISLTQKLLDPLHNPNRSLVTLPLLLLRLIISKRKHFLPRPSFLLEISQRFLEDAIEYLAVDLFDLSKWARIVHDLKEKSGDILCLPGEMFK